MMRELQPEDPQLIGPYRLRGRLGAGGMGRVYLGLSPDGRAAAVKVIRADLAQDPEFRARFRREITVARKVSGSFTAPVIDADLDGPVPWLATVYVPGPSLADAVSQHGPLPLRSVLALAAGLAEGLNAIHAAGVVHRDLKPANVLLAEDGPRVIDFGISRAIEAERTHPHRTSRRLPGVHVTGTGRRPLGRAAQRHLQPRRGAGLRRHRPGTVRHRLHPRPGLPRGAQPAQPRTTCPPRSPLVERCLAKDPAQRPTAAQLLAGAAYPATGWLPEPVTRTFSQVGPAVSAPLTVTAAALAARGTGVAPLGMAGRTGARAGIRGAAAGGR